MFSHIMDKLYHRKCRTTFKPPSSDNSSFHSICHKYPMSIYNVLQVNDNMLQKKHILVCYILKHKSESF